MNSDIDQIKATIQGDKLKLSYHNKDGLEQYQSILTLSYKSILGKFTMILIIDIHLLLFRLL